MNRDEVIALFVGELHGEILAQDRARALALRSESLEYDKLFQELKLVFDTSRRDPVQQDAPREGLTDLIILGIEKIVLDLHLDLAHSSVE